MLNLSLIRHAKSDWSNYDGDDMARPISSKGVKKTKSILKFLKETKKTYHLTKYFALLQEELKKR